MSEEPDKLGQLLEQWREVLEDWLATGAITPSAQARLALQRQLESEGMAGWTEVHRLAGILLGEAETQCKAAALLDLWVWVESGQRIYDAGQLNPMD